MTIFAEPDINKKNEKLTYNKELFPALKGLRTPTAPPPHSSMCVCLWEGAGVTPYITVYGDVPQIWVYISSPLVLLWVIDLGRLLLFWVYCT